ALRRPPIIAPGGGAPNRACSASSSSVAGRSVRWMVKLQPSLSVSALAAARGVAGGAKALAELVGLGSDLAAVTRDPRVVLRLPGFGAAGRDGAGAFRLDELDAAGIGKCLLAGIDDLHGVTMRAGGGELRKRGANLCHGTPEIRDHDDLGQRRRREGWRQARTLGHVMQYCIRQLVQHVAA